MQQPLVSRNLLPRGKTHVKTLPQLHSCCWDKTPQQSNLRRNLFWLSLGVQSTMEGKSRLSGAWSSRSHCICSQEEESNECSCSASSLLLIPPWSPAQGMVPPTVGSTPQARPEACLSGSSRCHQPDS